MTIKIKIQKAHPIKQIKNCKPVLDLKFPIHSQMNQHKIQNKVLRNGGISACSLIHQLTCKQNKRR